MTRTSSTLHTLAKGLKAPETIEAAEHGLTLTEIAHRLRESQTVVFRLLRTLAAPGYVHAGNTYSLFGSRTSIVEPVEAGRPLGRRDTFGLTRRPAMEGGRKAVPPERVNPLPPIRPEVSWDVTARLEDMDRDAAGDGPARERGDQRHRRGAAPRDVVRRRRPEPAHRILRGGAHGTRTVWQALRREP